MVKLGGAFTVVIMGHECILDGSNAID